MVVSKRDVIYEIYNVTNLSRTKINRSKSIHIISSKCVTIIMSQYRLHRIEI